MAQDRFASLRSMKIGKNEREPTSTTSTALATTPPPPQQSNPVAPPTPAPTPNPVSIADSNTQSARVSAREVPKRNNPDFQQVNTYIPKGIHQLVWIELVKQTPRGQFDVLVTDLLRNWLIGKGITADLDGKPL